MAAITWPGSFAAMSVTRSPSPRAATSSTIWRACAPMFSLSFRIIRGVKPRLTMSRYRVWIGGSMLMIDVRTG